MTPLDEHGRPEPPLTGDEAATLLGYLDYQRATLEWKCSGLDAAGLAATLAPTSMTLGGLLKHIAHVEERWISYRFAGFEPGPPWSDEVWSTDKDWGWHSAVGDSPDELRTLWRETVARSRALVAQALETGTMDQLAARPLRDGRTPSLRWIVCHLIEEYARHNGHADLLRESIDGQVGE